MGSKKLLTENEIFAYLEPTVACRICGRKLRQITFTHLSRKHKIDVKAYLKMFPNAELMPPKDRSEYPILSWSQIKYRKKHEVSLEELKRKGFSFK